MKHLCLMALMMLAGKASLYAQANTNAVLNFARSPAVITSHSVYFDMNANRFFFFGDVHVDDPQMKLTCEWMAANMLPGSGSVNDVDCQTNVVIDFSDDKGQTNHATSERAVYVCRVEGLITNETVTLTGHPVLDTASARTRADVIIWDRVNNHVYFTNEIIMPRPNPAGPPTGTNAMTANTNHSAGLKKQ